MRPDTPNAQPDPPPIRLAWDDFESGDLSGGAGWLDSWIDIGDVAITPAGGPFEGTFHMRLQGSTGPATTTVDRPLDLTGQTKVRLQFQWKANLFQPGDTAVLTVDDGVTVATVFTWADGQDDNTYHQEDLDLSTFTCPATS